MNKNYIFIAVAIVAIGILGYSFTGMTSLGEERGCGVQPYEADNLSVDKTVCVEGDLVDVYTVESTGNWTFIEEYEAPYALKVSEGMKGYECYDCPESSYTWVIFVVIGLVAAGIGFYLMKKKSKQ